MKIAYLENMDMYMTIPFPVVSVPQSQIPRNLKTSPEA